MVNCWGITDGSAGMIAQVRALAEAIGMKPIMKKIALEKPFYWLPNCLYASPLHHLILPYALTPDSDPLTAPWPELVISCGRRAGMVAMALRASLKGKPVRFIHIQDPQMSAKYFDLVVAMEHDKIQGNNVIKTRFALHSVNKKTLDQARKQFQARFSPYPAPYIAVLIGGSTNRYTLSESGMAQMIHSLKTLLAQTSGSLLMTPSRRTGEDNIAQLKAALGREKRVFLYNGLEENPYLGMLALAEAIVVTNDSVNMMSEAAATGKPLYILPLPGHTDTKPARFAEMLIREGIARPLSGRLERWSYPPSDEMQQLAGKVQSLLAA